MLVAVGVFSLVADQDAVTEINQRLEGVVPQEALTLLDDTSAGSPRRSRFGAALIIVGSVLAFWTLTGSMQTLMWALNTAYDREETRGFVTAPDCARNGCPDVARVRSGVRPAVLGAALLGVDRFGGRARVVRGLAVVDCPVALLIGGLLFAFATILYLGPNVDHPRWRFVTFGTAISVVVWLLASGGFALYVSQFSSYNKAWGSLAAVIIMLTWLWISGLALLFGAEVNAEAERRRKLRRGEPPSRRRRRRASRRRLSGALTVPGPTYVSGDAGYGAAGVAMNSAPTEGVRTVHLPQIKSTVPVYKNRATASAPSNSRTNSGSTPAVNPRAGYAAALSRSCKSCALPVRSPCAATPRLDSGKRSARSGVAGGGSP